MVKQIKETFQVSFIPCYFVWEGTFACFLRFASSRHRRHKVRAEPLPHQKRIHQYFWILFGSSTRKSRHTNNFAQIDSLFNKKNTSSLEYYKSLVYFHFHNNEGSGKGTPVQLAISWINRGCLCSCYCIPPLLRKRWEKCVLFRFYCINYASVFINTQWTLTDSVMHALKSTEYGIYLSTNSVRHMFNFQYCWTLLFGRIKWIWQASIYGVWKNFEICMAKIGERICNTLKF